MEISYRHRPKNLRAKPSDLIKQHQLLAFAHFYQCINKLVVLLLSFNTVCMLNHSLPRFRGTMNTCVWFSFHYNEYTKKLIVQEIVPKKGSRN